MSCTEMSRSTTMTGREILKPHQTKAIDLLKTGSVLCGGVGSGKSIVSLVYYFEKVFPAPDRIIIITTAKKRDTKEWLHDFELVAPHDFQLDRLIVDSWNNIKKYVASPYSFFIFDEQRVVGSGTWVKSFYKITKKNPWILLSATPGDTWLDYIPLFVANGFYKNRKEFIEEHVVYNGFVKFPKVDRYVNVGRLLRLRNSILVDMPFERPTVRHNEIIEASYDIEGEKVLQSRWNFFEDKPTKDISQHVQLLRRLVNSDPSRFAIVRALLTVHKKLIVFYNYDYELFILRKLEEFTFVAEHNGHKHDPLPTGDEWVYLVQYLSGSEGWNCVTTNTVVFYSLNYSERIMEQASGRIDRMNTPYKDLFYYRIVSKAPIDKAIMKSLQTKKIFSERKFLKGEFNENTRTDP